MRRLWPVAVYAFYMNLEWFGSWLVRCAAAGKSRWTEDR